MKNPVTRLLSVFGALFLCVICAAAMSVVSFAAGETESMVATEDSSENQPQNNEKTALFVPSSDEPAYFYQNGKEYSLFPSELMLDITGDGKCTALDAREILRITAGLVQYDGDVSALDVNGDGNISAFDARLTLRYSARLDRYYFDENGGSVSGFVTDRSGDIYYFGAYGSLASGITNIDGAVYCFGSDGKMQTGLVRTGGEIYYFDNNGKAYSGAVTISGKQYQFENGKAVTGWVFSGLNAYYYYPDGHMAQNERMDGFSFNASGVASATTLNKTTLAVYLRDILKKNGSSPSAIYNYVHNNYRYKYLAKASPDDMVIRMLQNKRGACYDYAYLTKYLLEAAGYECYVVVGDSFNPRNGSEHDWVLVKVNGVWRHMDTQKGTYLKTDREMRNLGYNWKQGSLPPAV